MRNAAVILILVTITSGCIHSGAQTIPDKDNRTGENLDAPEKLFAHCNDIRIRIDSASPSSAMIRQMNNLSIGKVKVKWIYSDGSISSKNVNLSNRGDLKMLSSSQNGQLERLTVTSERCQERSAVFTP